MNHYLSVPFFFFPRPVVTTRENDGGFGKILYKRREQSRTIATKRPLHFFLWYLPNACFLGIDE